MNRPILTHLFEKSGATNFESGKCPNVTAQNVKKYIIPNLFQIQIPYRKVLGKPLCGRRFYYP
jgi:hypothetical protein